MARRRKSAFDYIFTSSPLVWLGTAAGFGYLWYQHRKTQQQLDAAIAALTPATTNNTLPAGSGSGTGSGTGTDNTTLENGTMIAGAQTGGLSSGLELQYAQPAASPATAVVANNPALTRALQNARLSNPNLNLVR